MSPTFYYSEINLIESRRVDFNLEDYNCEHYIEIKQVNLVDSRGIPDFQILQPNAVLNIRNKKDTGQTPIFDEILSGCL